MVSRQTIAAVAVIGIHAHGWVPTTWRAWNAGSAMVTARSLDAEVCFVHTIVWNLGFRPGQVRLPE